MWVGQNGFRFVLEVFIPKVAERKRRFQSCHSRTTFTVACPFGTLSPLPEHSL